MLPSESSAGYYVASDNPGKWLAALRVRERTYGKVPRMNPVKNKLWDIQANNALPRGDLPTRVENANIPIDICLDVAGVMILFIRADEEVGLVNLKGREILGCSEEEIVGRNS